MFPASSSCSSISHHFLCGLCGFLSPLYSVPSPPTLLKQLSISAATCQVVSSRHFSPDMTWLLQGPLFRLSCILLCSSVTSHWHFGAQPQSSSILSCWSKRERAAWLFSTSCCPGAAGQAILWHWEWEASSALSSYTSWWMSSVSLLNFQQWHLVAQGC